MDEVVEPLRARNMQARRARIFDEARRVIAGDGVDRLNLRDLASAAGVTVPTIYNLIGSKEELLVALFADILDDLTARIDAAPAADPLAVAEALVIQSAEVFGEDEGYYRAAFLAIDHVHRQRPGGASVARLYARGDRLLIAGIAACGAARLLRGRIAPAALLALISRAFNENLRYWAAGLIPLAAFRERALADLYVTLAADAVETFHACLIRKLAALGADAHDGRESHEA